MARGSSLRGLLGRKRARGGVSAVSPSSAAAMAAAMAVGLGELGSVCLGQRGKGEREGGNACCASSRERRGPREQGAGEGAHGTARRVVAVALRQPSSACAPGDGAAWRSREASGRNRGHDAWPTSGRDAVPDIRRRQTAPSRRDTGMGDGVDGKLVNNSKFQSAVCKFGFSPSTWPQMKNF